MLSIIVAIAKNNVIGKDNKLIWHLPEDLKRFKRLTTGHTIIMGRKTFESLGRILPNRHHVILCNDAKLNISDEENFVIGGATMYKLLMPYCKKMYITEINKDFDGDVWFPKIDLDTWKITNKEKGLTDENNPFEYEYVTYEKI